MANNKRSASVALAQKDINHLSKAEIAKRQMEEVTVPISEIVAPDYLSGPALKNFNRIKDMMVRINEQYPHPLYTSLDEEALATYCVERENYLKYHKKLIEAEEKETDIYVQKHYAVQMRNALQDARRCASDLGLYVKDRCRLVNPNAMFGNTDSDEYDM